MSADPSELDDLRQRVVALEQRVADVNALVTPPPLPPAAVLSGRAELLSVPAPEVPPAPAPVVPSPNVVVPDGRASIPWVGAAGALLFLVGMGYGLAVSIEQGWLSAPVRVAVGLLAGVGLVLVAGRLLLRGGSPLGVGYLAAGVGTWMFALYYGAHDARLFAPAWAWLGAWVAVLAGGGLAARSRQDGALAVSLAVGCLAPPLFRETLTSLPVLLTHVLVLGGGALTILYLSGTGARWRWSRLVLALGAWLLAAWGTARLLAYPFPAPGFALLIALAGLGLVLAWLPRHPETPAAPGAMTAAALVGFALAWWHVGHALAWPREAFAVALGALALVSLGLIAPARRRMGGREHDLALGLLGAGFLLLAVPVAVEWRWVGLGWSLGAVALSLATIRAADHNRPNLLLIAFVVAVAASAVWVNESARLPRDAWPLLNLAGVSGTLVALAWAGLATRSGPQRGLVVVVAQAVGVHVVAWELRRGLPDVAVAHLLLPLGSLAVTLSYGVVGAAQWWWSLARDTAAAGRRAVRGLGYVWLAAAGLKLMVYDLAEADRLTRATAALAVGALLLGAAFAANRRRRAG
jgi:hypothetical protein